MSSNNQITFNLTRGNANNDPVGIGLDRQVFGKSLGGMFFDTEIIANQEVIKFNLQNNTNEVFDSIVPTDVIKSQVNYRAVYITNRSSTISIPLNKILVSDVVPDPRTSIVPGASGAFAISDISIAIEGVYTISEAKRTIPAPFGRAINPSLVIDDEYDSTKKLLSYTFKKSLDAIDLPIELPPECVLKLWIKREIVVDKLMMPDDEITESFQLIVEEYGNGNITSIDITYDKNKGRVPLANWYDYTITTGYSTPIIMKELLPKDVNIEYFNIVNTFVVGDKVLIFYYVNVGSSRNYFVLSVKPDDDPTKNKYTQVQLNFNPILASGEEFTGQSIISIQKSYYDSNKFYIFWNEDITTVDPCRIQFFGSYENYKRLAVDELATYIWTDDKLFDSIVAGYDNRRIESYEVLDYKIIREKVQAINVEMFDDLFIIFTKDMRNQALNNIEDIVLNKNELIYIFEKDIQDPEKYSGYKHYPGTNSTVFSQRLYPSSLPSVSYKTSINNTKKSDSTLLITDSNEISTNVDAHRRIKYLLDGTRYVDMNSVHGHAFSIGTREITYELPTDVDGLTNISFTASLSVNNDTNIYSTLKQSYQTTYTINNNVDGTIYEKPLFQQNIIDSNNYGSLSIPIEWADRNYKNEWKTILATHRTDSTKPPVYSLQYNFYCNMWRSVYLNKNEEVIITEHNNLVPSSSTETTGSSGTDGACKLYQNLDIRDVSWVIEPDVFQPITIQISANQIFSRSFKKSKYVINIKVYYKGNEIPLADVITYSDNITDLSYVIVNPDNSISYRTNYCDLYNVRTETGNLYRILNLHNSLLNKTIADVGPEFTVNPQLNPVQAEFRNYRIIKFRGLKTPTTSNYEMSSDITVPIIIYGNGYKAESNSYNPFLEVEHPFDFSKISINDRSIRIFSENNSKIPLKFKIAYYDYDKDFIVIWVRLQDSVQNNIKLFMYYNKIDTTEDTKNIYNNYTFIKSSIYPTAAIGVWHCDKILDDSRLAFNDGKIFNAGEPVVYEKTLDNEIRLTQIEKEYMFGIAKIFKSQKFNLNFDVENLEEPELFLDTENKEDFEKFIRDAAQIFKPSYTEINEIKPFNISVLESGEGNMGTTNNRRVTGLIAMTPSSNVNTYYERSDNSKFNMLSSFNGFSQIIDWVIAQQTDSSVFKSGVLKINGKVKSEVIKFDKPFRNSDYFVFISNPVNQKLYWNILCPDRFTISSSYYLQREVSWMAFHRDVFGGVFTANSMFVGKRTLSNGVFIDENGTSYAQWPGDDLNIVFPQPTTANLGSWYNNELIIKPEYGVEGDPGSMSIDPTNPGYSLILSANENINIYWAEKSINQFRVRTSSPTACTVHYLAIKNGIEWWKEII
jgi:hypothetical protein